MPALLIPDGYTTDFTIEAQGKLPPIKGKLRCALAQAMYEFTYPKQNGKAVFEATVKLLADHLVSWDVAGPDGKTVPITAENLARLPLVYLEKLVDKVCSYAPEQQAADLGN